MRWTLKKPPEKEQIHTLATALSVDTTIAKLLLLRNIKTFDEAKKFFRPSLEDLHNPFLMKDMELAVQRIETAISNNENILIYGDYDVDGTTAVSLVSSYLKTYYDNIATYIPDRYDEGYGISYKAIDFAQDNNFSLIIALDCGIKAIDKIDYANQKGIDFIICDHHKPGKKIPKAIAVLNPKRKDCTYPFDELCGCGVGFKLIQALGAKKNQTIDHLVPYLDLVATAIAADIVPINGENRTLAYFGLQVINSNPRNGIKAIIHQLKKPVLTITDVVFIIAPRINAAGRMEHGQHAVNLLTETDIQQATKFAAGIEKYNIDRMNSFISYGDMEAINRRFSRRFNLPKGAKYKSNVLEYKKDYTGLHPTQKPVALMEDLIRTYTNKGDTVLDFTMGSGTTGVAAKNLNRKFIGIELDEVYFDIARKRIGEAKQ